MNFYLTIPLLTGVALLQTVVLPGIEVFGTHPDLNLMLLVVLIWALERNIDEGLVWGFLGGLMLDLLSGGPLAAIAMALLAVAFLAGQSLGQGIGSSVVQLLLVTFLGVVAYHLVLLLVLDWTGRTVDWGVAWIQTAGPSVLLNMALAPFIQRPLIWLERRTRQEGFAP